MFFYWEPWSISKLLEPFFIFFLSCSFTLGIQSFLLFLLAAPPFFTTRTAGTARARTKTGWPRCDRRSNQRRTTVSFRARGSSFSWLRWRSRKRAPAPLRLRRGSCSSGVHLAGLRQEPEPEPLVEPCQTTLYIT